MSSRIHKRHIGRRWALSPRTRTKLGEEPGFQTLPVWRQVTRAHSNQHNPDLRSGQQHLEPRTGHARSFIPFVRDGSR